MDARASPSRLRATRRSARPLAFVSGTAARRTVPRGSRQRPHRRWSRRQTATGQGAPHRLDDRTDGWHGASACRHTDTLAKAHACGDAPLDGHSHRSHRKGSPLSNEAEDGFDHANGMGRRRGREPRSMGGARRLPAPQAEQVERQFVREARPRRLPQAVKALVRRRAVLRGLRMYGRPSGTRQPMRREAAHHGPKFRPCGPSSERTRGKRVRTAPSGVVPNGAPP